MNIISNGGDEITRVLNLISHLILSWFLNSLPLMTDPRAWIIPQRQNKFEFKDLNRLWKIPHFISKESILLGSRAAHLQFEKSSSIVSVSCGKRNNWISILWSLKGSRVHFTTLYFSCLHRFHIHPWFPHPWHNEKPANFQYHCLKRNNLRVQLVDKIPFEFGTESLRVWPVSPFSSNHQTFEHLVRI